MRILLIEDSERLQRSISMGLRKAGYRVDMTGDGEEGLWYAESHDYDVIILDLMLPGLDGLTILHRLREKRNPVHVLILSAKDTLEDRVTGLRNGADDYLVKPFAFDELLARVQALFRRRYGIKDDVVTVGGLRIDTAARTVTRDGKSLELPPREYALLELLALNRGKLVTRPAIEERIYDDVEPFSNVVDSAICALRKRIDEPGQPSHIQTRRGHGYMIPLDTPRP